MVALRLSHLRPLLLPHKGYVLGQRNPAVFFCGSMYKRLRSSITAYSKIRRKLPQEAHHCGTLLLPDHAYQCKTYSLKHKNLLQHISERVQAMGFQEATTEIWSVDSQYSKDNGVMVLVTGSLQCKVQKSPNAARYHI